MTLSTDDLRRFEAWVAYRDSGKWNCPRCGFDRHHYIGGHYCSGCRVPLSVVCLYPPSPDEQKRADENRLATEQDERDRGLRS